MRAHTRDRMDHPKETHKRKRVFNQEAKTQLLECGATGRTMEKKKKGKDRYDIQWGH